MRKKHKRGEEMLGQELHALLRGEIDQEPVTREKAMNIATVASCVEKISGDIAALPVRLYKKEKNKVTEVTGDSRVCLLNGDTGDTLTGTQLKKALVRDFFMGKGGYAYIDRGETGVRGIHYVKEQEVTFQFNTDPIFKTYEILVNAQRYQPYEFLKLLRNTENGRDGISIVKQSQLLLSVVYASAKFEENLVKTGGNKKGFIETARRIAPEVMDLIRNAWKKLYSNNEENVVVLNEGISFKESSNTSVEMQLQENKEINAKEVCKLFQVPPTIVMGRATEQDKIAYVQECLNPILNELEGALNRDLLLEKEKEVYFFEVDISELTKGDIEKRYKAYEIASKNGFMQTDEIRFRENLPELGLHFVKLGLQDVLYDTKTKEIFIPNMNATATMGEGTIQKEKPEQESTEKVELIKEPELKEKQEPKTEQESTEDTGGG